MAYWNSTHMEAFQWRNQVAFSSLSFSILRSIVSFGQRNKLLFLFFICCTCSLNSSLSPDIKSYSPHQTHWLPIVQAQIVLHSRVQIVPPKYFWCNILQRFLGYIPYAWLLLTAHENLCTITAGNPSHGSLGMPHGKGWCASSTRYTDGFG